MKGFGWVIAIIFALINTAMNVQQDKLKRKADDLEIRLMATREWNNTFLKEAYMQPKENQ